MIDSELSEVRRLHAAGLLDSEISDVTGIPHDSVTWFREKIGLRSNKWLRGLDYDAAIREMNAAGRNDVEIGRLLGISKSNVGNRRNVMGLPAVGYSPRSEVHRPGPNRTAPDNCYRIALVYRRISDGATDSGISRETGIAAEKVAVLRARMPKWWKSSYDRVQFPKFLREKQ